MSFLFLSRWFPYPPDNGARIRIFNLLKALSRVGPVDLISFAEESPRDGWREALLQVCRRVEVVRYRSFNTRSWKAISGYLTPYPRSVVDTFSLLMQSRVMDLSRNESYSATIASEIDMLPYLRSLTGTKRILEELELAVLHDQYTRAISPLRKARHGLTWWKLANYVASSSRFLDGCTVVSEQELHLARRLLGISFPIEIISNGVDTVHYSGEFGLPEPDTLIYSGALTYQANFDAVAYFLEEIYPLIRARRPQVRFKVTGRLDGVPLKRLPAHEGVEFTGYVDDIRPVVARSWVSVVPLRIGGGTRLKILESLVLGTPVVSTPKGADGLELVPGEHLLLADQPGEFAGAVLSLLEDRDARARLSDCGRLQVVEKYDWKHIGRRLADFIENTPPAAA